MEPFAELRSLMHRDALDARARRQLWHLIRESARENPARHRDQWLPYLSDFDHHFESAPITEAISFVALQEAVEWLPFGLFSFVLGSVDRHYARITQIARSHELERVVRLDMRPIVLKPGALKMWWGSSHMSHLRALWIDATTIHDHARAFVESRCLVALTELHVEWIFDTIAERLAQTDALRGLRTLHLEHARLGASALDTLLCAESMSEVEQLDLSGGQFEGDWVEVVERWLSSRSMVRLWLRNLRLTGEDARRLIDALSGETLVELALDGNVLGDDVAEAIAHAPQLAHLESLELDEGAITQEGARAIVESPYLSKSIRLRWRRRAMGR